MVPAPVLRKPLLAILFLWVLPAVAASTESFPAGTEHRFSSLSEDLSYLRDSEHRLSVTDVIQSLDELPWETTDAAVPNLGMSADTIWFRVTLKHTGTEPRHAWLELAYAKLDDVRMYFVREGDIVQQEVFGDLLPFSARPINHRNFIAPVTLPPQSETELIMSVRNGGALQMPLRLWEKEYFLEQDQSTFALQMMFAGLMTALGVYNLLLLFSIRDISYLWYVINVFSIALAQLSISGITSQFLWPEWPELNHVSLVALFSLSMTTGSLFTYHFLQLPKHSSWCARAVLLMTGWGLVLFMASFVLDYTLVLQTLSVSAAIITPFILAIGIYLWARGVVLARIFTIAWSFLLIGHTLQAMSKLGFLPRLDVFEHAPQIGTSAEMLLLSFALAYRFNEERRQRIQAQKKALEVQRAANLELESRVQARTEELEVANRQLEAISQVDGLTGLKNRRFFDEALVLECRKGSREQSELSLLMIDVDQ